MDTKIAYCCLNCTASANCCGACGECPACCENCDTSECSSSAYFYGGNFYKHFVLVAQEYEDTLFDYYDGNYGHNFLTRGYYSSSYDTEYDSPCCVEGWKKTYDDSVYWSKQDIKYNCEETTIIEDYEDCDDCPATTTVPSQCYIGAALYTNENPVPATECFPQFPEFQEKEGTVACTNVPSCYNPQCEFYCDGKAYIQFYSQINFSSPLNLYNKDGQDVGNTIGATYNPCNPTVSWSAPACHFFAP